MKISTSIVIQKYYEEIEILKRALLKRGAIGLKNDLFLEIIKFVLNNCYADEAQINSFASKLKINAEIVKDIFHSFYGSSEINVINFDFSKELMKESNFKDDSEVIRFILTRLRSPQSNTGLFDELKLEDLVSKNSLDKMNKFLEKCLLNTNLIKYFNNLRDEIKSDYEYIEAKVRIKDPLLMEKGGKYLKGFNEFKRCYIKLMYPLVSLHDIKDLNEIITTKLDYLEIKDAQD